MPAAHAPPRPAALLRHTALLGLLAVSGCIGNPTADAVTAEAINEIGYELTMLRDENATLQFQVDSLRSVVARQDTVLRQVANLAGMPLPP